MFEEFYNLYIILRFFMFILLKLSQRDNLPAFTILKFLNLGIEDKMAYYKTWLALRSTRIGRYYRHIPIPSGDISWCFMESMEKSKVSSIGLTLWVPILHLHLQHGSLINTAKGWIELDIIPLGWSSLREELRDGYITFHVSIFGTFSSDYFWYNPIERKNGRRRLKFPLLLQLFWTFYLGIKILKLEILTSEKKVK